MSLSKGTMVGYFRTKGAMVGYFESRNTVQWLRTPASDQSIVGLEEHTHVTGTP